MDYRLKAVRDAATASVRYCNEQVATLRASTQGGREINTRVEQQIARKQGEAAIYQWCVDQLASFTIPAAGQGGDTGSEGHNLAAKPGRSCGPCSNQLAEAREAFDRMTSEGNNYGWGDSDCARARERLGMALRNLRDYFNSH